jgi:NTP pyrophosphatase (non-canonical NTP hydrolase)
MDIKEYMRLSEKTLSDHFMVDSPAKEKMLHAVIGLVTESSELLDQFKKHIFYKKELDLVNVKEEMGDVMRYVAILLRELDLDFHQILDDNITKLKKRYGEKFDEGKAANRDIDNELSHFNKG